MVPTAIPAMAPGDKPGRAVVSGGKLVAVGERHEFSISCHLSWGLTSAAPKEWH